MNISLFNAKSIKNKIDRVHAYLLPRCPDAFAFTEIWLAHDDDYLVGPQCCPEYYKFISCSCEEKRGGGVGIFHKQSLDVKLLKSMTNDNWEYLVMFFQTTSLLLILVYRPPATNFSVFIEEFAEVRVENASNFTNILCLGDFNVHAELETDSRASRLFSVISEAGLEQHILEPTHVSGHTLDLIISTYTPANNFVNDEIAGDHNCIYFNYPTVTQTSVSKKTVVYRRWKNITLESLSNTFKLLINQKWRMPGIAAIHLQPCLLI